jgi:hypothetical protein
VSLENTLEKDFHNNRAGARKHFAMLLRSNQLFLAQNVGKSHHQVLRMIKRTSYHLNLWMNAAFGHQFLIK